MQAKVPSCFQSFPSSRRAARVGAGCTPQAAVAGLLSVVALCQTLPNRYSPIDEMKEDGT